MVQLHYFLFFTSLILASNAAEFNITFNARPNLEQSITSGHRVLNGILTIPDMFIKPSSKRRRLKEIASQPTSFTTPSPTSKITLPVVVLIHPEGPQDRALSIYGSQFNMHQHFYAQIFDDLKDSLVSDGKMAVIQYDKRNCKYPFCDDLCPSICPNLVNSCNLFGECYNDTNITFSDLVEDAKAVFIQGHKQIKAYLNEDIVDLNRIWTIPIGFSFQGASIATYIASKYCPHKWPTLISLMGSAIPIDELLINQLRMRINNGNHSDIKSVNEAISTLKEKFECIKNATYKETDIVAIDNDFLSDIKYVKYWKDWLNMTQDIDYGEIVNFMAINSGDDDCVTPSSFSALNEMFFSNISMDINVIKNINHYMINVNDWLKGKWTVDDRISQHIIHFINDISGYLDGINRWRMLNHTDNTVVEEEIPAENDMVYKLLLYIVIMGIILILACGIYCVIANKVCPYEFEEDDNDNNDMERERERRRRRRRRHRRERRRSHRSNRSVAHDEPMIQSLLQPLSPDNQDNGNNNNGNPMLNEEYVD